MHVEFLVEEPSAEVALKALVPKILRADVTFDVHAFQGKQDLLNNLESRLKGYSPWLPRHWRIVVLIDEDRQTCKELKQKLEEASARAGLTTKSSVTVGEQFQVLNRIAVEELEAWFLGDVPAIVKAYPRVPSTLDRKAKFRGPDAIKGGTWEALERVLQKAGYHQGGLNKIAVARDISPHLCPQRNRSKSFQVFRDGLQQLL